MDLIDYINIQKIIFSAPLDKTEKFAKLAGRRIKIKGADYIQFEGFYNNQAFHENILINDLSAYFGEKILKYKKADIFLSGSHYMAFNKNGEIAFHKTKTKIDNQDNPVDNHNRRKNHIINEGDNIPVFIELGIFTKDYKIINSMYGKFRQINRFAELFDDVSDKIDAIYKKRGKINVVDLGCGKSYLTFVLYFYFTNIKKYPEDSVKIVGVDLKEKSINECDALARKYKYKNLEFETGDIKNYAPDFTPDIVVSLHGCDIATDYAIYNALKWQSEIIFAAPCCEHEINAQIDIKSMRNILKYGVIKERFSTLLTNSIRCNILELKNYKTELIEFVDTEHSPKNLLIRAVKSGSPENYNNINLKKELEETLDKFKISQSLYNLLKAEKI